MELRADLAAGEIAGNLRAARDSIGGVDVHIRVPGANRTEEIGQRVPREWSDQGGVAEFAVGEHTTRQRDAGGSRSDGGSREQALNDRAIHARRRDMNVRHEWILDL